MQEKKRLTECTGEQFVVTGEIQRGANNELIRVGRELVDYVICEGKEKEVPQDEELDKQQGIFQ